MDIWQESWCVEYPFKKIPLRLLQTSRLLVGDTPLAFLNPFIKINDVCGDAEIPGSNGHGKARSLARIASIIANNGELEGRKLLSDKVIQNVKYPRVRRRDSVLCIFQSMVITHSVSR